MAVAVTKVNDLDHLNKVLFFYHLWKLKKAVIEMVRMNRLKSYPLVFLFYVFIELELTLFL